ncbi:WcaI family glycosyltransferase [Novosphingobium sp. KCTC 2891]|uniref:WcaI family glycosyltransferase n=1 Tax=Novosphingobium sp. KCTC 2891 TaxID=2989730 RepID=UPI002221CC61|nr:WcaI family glycosyltransferase [Novosphingobium sp. KCTC 2891]MCW1383268.1 WcaI family glycosyltransferase [Novosphingobium sp. KCTC 2891]
MIANKAPILLIGVNYAPEPVGIGPYSAGLAEALADEGHAVTFVAGQPYYPQWKRWPGYARGWRRTREDGVEVIRCPHYIPAKPGGLKRILHLASYAASSLLPALAAALRKRPGVVLVVAPALLSVPVGWLSARLSGAKLWIHVQDFEVDAAMATGLVQQRGLLPRLALALERALLRSADRVSTISPQMCAKLTEKGVDPARIVEARNWANMAFARADASGDEYRRAWNLGDRKVALYSGNIANKQGIEIIIEAARLLAHRSDLVFVICGEGPNRARLAELSQGLGNVQLHDLQPAERVADMLALASIHLLPQIPGAADLVLPSKLANMLGSGRPVVATAAPGTGLADEVEGAGLVTQPGDAPALAGAIVRLLDDSQQAARLGETGRERARERWGRDALLANFVGRIGAAGKTPR